MTEWTPEEVLTTAETILAESNQPKTSLATQIGHFSTAETSEDLAFDEGQTRITPIQRSLCALVVRGFSLMAGCRKLNVNYAAACRWKKLAWWEPVCEEERNKWLEKEGIDTPQEVFAPLVGLALDALRAAMESEDEKIKIAAANLVFERFFSEGKRPVGRPKTKIDPEMPPDLTDLQKFAAERVLAMQSSIREGETHVSVVANG